MVSEPSLQPLQHLHLLIARPNVFGQPNHIRQDTYLIRTIDKLHIPTEFVSKRTFTGTPLPLTTNILLLHRILHIPIPAPFPSPRKRLPTRVRRPPKHGVLPQRVIKHQRNGQHQRARQQHNSRKAPPHLHNRTLGTGQDRRRAAGRMHSVGHAHRDTGSGAGDGSGDPVEMQEKGGRMLESLGNADADEGRDGVAEDVVARLRERGLDRVVIQHRARAQTCHDRWRSPGGNGWGVIEDCADGADAGDGGEEGENPLDQ